MGDYFVCSKTDPVVETKAGKVRGFRLNTTYAFHGIHYAEADRFQMPQPVKPWKGIKNALAYKNMIGYSPETTFEKGIERFIKWYNEKE